ncbi:MAG: cob(I)yrinic acid a,c-diamide adenosyltransferase [Saprospiraceae bacterium]|nr:cob(I)yrinic acid a,c-diamide adenosyltransferase [Saprospiraceae bacterium]
MAFRIYTRTGDQGLTGLFGGKRVSKDDIRIEAYGTVDELNAVLGLLSDSCPDKDIYGLIRTIQSDLFTIGAHLARDPDKEMPLPPLPVDRIAEMEQQMDTWDEHLPALRHFILPAGHELVSRTHVARCVCRRAERRVVALAQVSEVEDIVVRYLNRLSDLLFVLARELGHRLGAEEVAWKPE